MDHEHPLILRVKEAKEDMRAADELIRAYMPFIRKETSKFLKRSVTEDHEDELSIAMIAFYEAISSYSVLRGPFLHYAALNIKSRLTDHLRKEAKHKDLLSLNAPISEESDSESTLLDTLSSDEDHAQTSVMRAATRDEIREFSASLEKFGITLTDIAEACPEQKRTLASCKKALEFALSDSELMDNFLRTGRLPLARLSEGAGVERKTLERHRKYVVGLLLAYTNGFEIIRGHLKHVLSRAQA